MTSITATLWDSPKDIVFIRTADLAQNIAIGGKPLRFLIITIVSHDVVLTLFLFLIISKNFRVNSIVIL